MEFSALIDKLDDMVTGAKKARRGREARVDKDEMSALVRQLRGAIPEELTQAQWISQNRAEMLAEAKRETARIVEEARDERDRLLSGDEVAKAAELRAQQVLEEAEASEHEIRLGAEAEALAILDALEAHMLKLVDAVVRGRDRLAERRSEREPAEVADGQPAERREAVLA